MRQGNRGQLRLRWEKGLRAQGVPESVEQACQELLRQLLREVVRIEHQGGSENEREDQPESS